ncbi:ABC transporter permease (plasmid) [Falsihalocynthiibacter sp. SS001]|uniref:ABC transporter permease n=1 Tax=Falsihalocynthiibacter sp. SS001 TaxID=3349698 RepID=UPI0036D3A37C
MARFILFRVLSMIPALLAISVLTFIVIQLPPGDFVSTLAAQAAETGNTMEQATLDTLRERYGIGDSVVEQYFRWIGGIVQGDFGYSFEWNQPVSQLVWERMAMTSLVAVLTLLFVWSVALPVGVYSAVNKYSIGDYVATLFGFIGMATPNFLLAIVLMYFATIHMGQSVGGLFSPEYVDAPWSFARLWDFLSHVWIPVIVLGTAGTAALIRVMRANLLDELGKPYVEAARARGVPERKLIAKYPVRVAINPFISTVGWVLPTLISGELIVSTVLNLPTAGPLLLQALKSQDMYLAGAFLLMTGALVLIGTLLSDILLAVIDPRIQFA